MLIERIIHLIQQGRIPDPARIRAGRGDGPLRPDPVAAGVLVGGFCPAATDEVAASLMGYDPACLPILAHTWDEHPFPVRLVRDPLVLESRPDGDG